MMNVDRSGPILCFGEMLLRLSAPPGIRLPSASSLDAHVGGAEANVAALLGQLGHDVEMITVLPNSSLGDLCEAELGRCGVGRRHIQRSDGRLGLYFVGATLGSGGQVIYDRKQSAFCQHAGEFDWSALAADARWFHLSGINLAIGDQPAKSALAAVQAMKTAGVPISFDVNHRSSLWKDKGAHDLGSVRTIAEQADLLFASALDIGRILAVELPSGTNEERRAAAEAGFAAFGAVQLIASTRRQFDEDRQLLSVRIDSRDDGFECAPAPLRTIIDRIGSGDAFAGAVIDGVLGGANLHDCALRGLGAAVSKHAIGGDRWIGSREELYGFDPFAAQDIQR